VVRRYRVVERFRLLVEGQLLSPEHRHPSAQGFELAREVAVPHHHQRVAGGRRRSRGEPYGHAGRVGLDHRQRPFDGGGLPLGRSVERVHVVRIVLPHGQHQLDVLLGERLHLVRLSRGGDSDRRRAEPRAQAAVAGRHW
jgi:hypothetical protein